MSVTPHARPWLRPPQLRTLAEKGEERRASWLELFFDLVFVVAIAELAQQLVRDHTLGGFAIFCALFMPVFLAWQGFSFYADRFDTDDVLFRAVMFAAMLAILTLAGQIENVARGHGDVGFVFAYVTLRGLVVGLNLRARRHVPLARPLVERYAAGYSAAIVLWLASLLVAPPWRYVIWGLAVAFEYSIPVLAQHLHSRIPINLLHVRERLALFTMIVLGESVVTVGLGTENERWNTGVAFTAALGFVVVASLWWVYFDRGVEEQLGARAGAAELYTRLHVPLLLGLTAVGAGVNLLIEPVGAAAAWAFDGGAALFLLCVTVAQALTSTGLDRAARAARVLCAALLLLCAVLGTSIDRLGVAAASAATLALLIAYEIQAGHRALVDEPPPE